MIAKEYQEFLKKELNFSAYLLLTLVVASLQLLKQVKLEVLAEALPLPILFESRRRKLRRFLKLDKLSEVLSQVLQLISEYIPVVLGDREFCSTKLGDWLGQKGAYFCLRQKCDTKIRQNNGLYQELREYGLAPGMKLFLNDKQVTKQKGFGTFNIAAKWKRNYQGFKTKEPWYILTNFEDLDTAIVAYQKRFNIEEMFRDFKLGGYNLEGSQLASELLSKKK